MFRNSTNAQPRQERWMSLATLLADYLENFQLQQELLREIDRRIIESRGTGLDSLLGYVVEQVQKLLTLNRVSFYRYENGVAVRRAVHGSDDGLPETLPVPDFDQCFETIEDGLGLWLPGVPTVCGLNLSCSCALAVPARHGESVQGLLLVESTQDARLSKLTDPETRRFLSSVAGQAAVALKFQEHLNEGAKLWNFANTLFQQSFDPTESLNEVARQFRKFLPASRYEAAHQDIQVEILFLEEEESRRTLAIRGTTATRRRPGVTRVDVKQSVCGVLFLNPGASHLLCDPQEDPYKVLYKNYLGKEVKGPIRCELVIPLNDDSGRFGVINLESPAKDCFVEDDVPRISETARLFTPILSSMRQRIGERELIQAGLMQGLEAHLNLVSTQYMHALRTPYLGLRMRINELKDCLQGNAKALGSVQELHNTVQQTYELHSKFAEDLSGFASSIKHAPAKIIRDAKNMCDPEELERNKGIRFEEKLDADIEVECTLFLKQVLYNIFQNSIYWLGKMREQNPAHQGVITLLLDMDKVPEVDEEVELNRFCTITIQDNGPGARKEELPRLLLPNYSTREGGTGLGLYMADQYVSSLGGKLALKSTPGQDFTVVISLRTVDPNVP